MKRASLLLVSLLGCGYGSSSGAYNGTDMSIFFPFDGPREAEYVNDDPEVVPHLYMHMELPNGGDWGDDVERETATLEYSLGEPGETATPFYSVQLSKLSHNATRIEGYAAGGEAVTDYENRLNLTGGDWLTGSTTSRYDDDGAYWTSKYVEVVDCPVPWAGVEATNCAHIHIDNDQDTEVVRPFFAGDYYLIPDYGIAWIQGLGDTEPWKLLDYTGGPEEE